MKTERRLDKMSLSDTLLFFVLFIVVINGTIFLYTVIKGKPGLFIHESSWISQFLFPFIYTLIYSGINRNGVLTITEYTGFNALKEQIEEAIIKNGLHIYSMESDSYIYKRRTKIGRFFSFFTGEKVTVKYTDTQILINSKRNILTQLEQALKK